DSLELVPFRAVFDAGIGSVMIAHLSVPAIDNAEHRATSISKNNVTGLLRDSMGYNGLTFTDALEMEGVAKYFPGGTISVEALIAGNDMLCLPASVPESIEAIKKAIAEKRLSWDDINTKVRKVLMAKYSLGLNQWKPIDTTNLLNDLNAKTDAIRYEVAQKTITVLAKASQTASRTDYADIPLKKGQKIAYVGIGTSQLNAFGKRLQEDFNADVFLFSYKDRTDKAAEILKAVPKDGKYDAIVIGVHDFSNRPAGNYNITPAAIELWKNLNFIKTVTMVFGNVLATKNFCEARTLVACYQDDDITQQVAADLLQGKINAVGKLPIRVCNFKSGDGIVKQKGEPVHSFNNLMAVDSIVNDAIAQKAFPGCVVLAVHDGEIIYHKAFGNYKYEPSPPMTYESIFDLASVTKISATTVSVMKLYDEGKLDIKKRLGDYLPWVKGTNKANLQLEDILLHQAGLVPFIAFYQEVIDKATGLPNPAVFSSAPKPGFTIRVAENVYMRNDWQDTMFHRILQSKLTQSGKYVYSDNDFIFLGKVVEQITGMTLDEYASKTFYQPMGMATTGFKPRNRFPVDRMVPTETEKHFRMQTTQGDVHDEGASMFGGVAGHAGLFSDAYDLAMLYQMLLNGGEFNGERYIKKETIDFFTAYHSRNSRR
ncbi:MAG TPA: serine hydrolase, partial [Chitinophagaceae bacterium]